MARNRNPEETRRKILEVSKELFLEKGFDNTSIQDIINGERNIAIKIAT